MSKKTAHPELTTVIGSIGAVIAAVGVTLLASASTPVVAGVVSIGGAAIAAAALLKKLNDEAAPASKSAKSQRR